MSLPSLTSLEISTNKRTRDDADREEDASVNAPVANPSLSIFPRGYRDTNVIIILDFSANVYELVYALLMFESLLRQIAAARPMWKDGEVRIRNSGSAENGLYIEKSPFVNFSDSLGYKYGRVYNEMRLEASFKLRVNPSALNIDAVWSLAMLAHCELMGLRAGKPTTETLKEKVDTVFGRSDDGFCSDVLTRKGIPPLPLDNDRMSKLQLRQAMALSNGGHYSLKIQEVQLLKYCLQTACTTSIDDPGSYRWYTSPINGTTTEVTT